MSWFVEEKTATSADWHKVEYRDHPEIDEKNMRIKSPGSIGPRIKAMPVNEDGKTLNQLQGGAP